MKELNDVYTQNILSNETICTDNANNRSYRDAISRLSKQGIIYIPIGNYRYKRIEQCTDEQVERHFKQQLSAIRTQYFNKIRPLKNYIDDKLWNELHEGGLFE